MIVIQAESVAFGSALYVLLSFILLMLIIKKLAWKPISDMLEKRSDEINNDLDSAKEANIKAKQNEVLVKKELEGAHTKASQIIKEANEVGQRQSESLISQAESQAHQISKQAEDEARNIKNNSFKESRSEMVDISTELAASLIKKNISSEDQELLVDQYINNLNKKEV